MTCLGARNCIASPHWRTRNIQNHHESSKNLFKFSLILVLQRVWHQKSCSEATRLLGDREFKECQAVETSEDRHEIYLRELRHDEHCIDRKGRHTAAFFGARKRKFAPDERQHIKDCLTLQDCSRGRTPVRLKEKHSINDVILALHGLSLLKRLKGS